MMLLVLSFFDLLFHKNSPLKDTKLLLVYSYLPSDTKLDQKTCIHHLDEQSLLKPYRLV